MEFKKPDFLKNKVKKKPKKEEKRQKKIITENRLATINRRETSYEGLVAQLENGEDGLYNWINEKNKQTIFKPKITIT